MIGFRMEMKFHIACMVVLLFMPTGSKSQSMLTLIEGDTANLTFQYPCNSTKVTLQHGYKSPFYRLTTDTDTESLSSSDQDERYIVQNNREGGDSCSLEFTIYPVSRSDSGTYICQVYKDGQLLPEYPRIGLTVEYPPGKASCELSEDYTYEDWAALSCTAPEGSLPGQIGCSQDSVVSPPVLRPTQTDGVVQHVFWVRYTHPVFCCSFISDQPKGRCECKDSVWVPYQNGTSDTSLGPCPVSTSVETPVTNSSSPKGSTLPPTQNPTMTADRSSGPFHWSFGLVIALLVILCALVGIGVGLVHYCIAFKKQRRLNRDSEREVEIHEIQPLKD